MKVCSFALVALCFTFCIANECNNAINLAIPSVTSSTNNLEPVSTISPDCQNGGTYDASAVWFSVTPPAGSLVTIHTCNSCFDTVLSVYTSSCNSLSCFVSNDDLEEPCPTTGVCPSYDFLLSSVTFCATGEEYKVLVRGFAGATGSFDINVELGESCTVPSNNNCATSQVVPVSLPQSYDFSTTFATGGGASCASVTEVEHSVWYRVTGNGGTLIAHTCDSRTDYSTAIAVFSGTCGALECISGNKVNGVSCPSYGLSYVAWCADSGTDYFVFVSGVNEFSFGNGKVTFEEGPEDCQVGSDGICTKPHQVVFDTSPLPEYVYTGETVIDSTNAVNLPKCDTSPMSRDTIQWFTVRGTGNIFVFETCGSEFDTVLNIFKGSCFGLSCVQWNDDSCGFQSRINLCTEAGVDYLIAVGGYNLDTGSFTFSVRDFGTCIQSPNCEEVAFFLPNDYSTVGDTSFIGSQVLNGPRCGSALLGKENSWFLVYGNDAVLTVTTCDSCFDTVLTVYESMDGCEEFRCVTYNDDHNGECFEDSLNQCTKNVLTSAVSFCAGGSSSYYIVVSGFAGDSGPFSLSVEESFETCSYNNHCEFAKPVVFGQVENVNTLYDIDYLTFECNNQYDGLNSAWYMLEGTGGLISVTDVSGIEVSILVWTSETGNCVYVPDICLEGQIFTGNSVEFCTKADTTYWVSVGGTSEQDILSFIFTEEGGCIDVENQYCENRDTIDISTHDVILRGSTIYSGGDYGSFICDGVRFSPPGYAWYSVIGAGREIQASLCDSDYDTIIGIFEASCDYRVCVTANDDFCSTQSSVTFCGLSGIEYYILVGGYSGFADQVISGSYELFLQENGVCNNNDPCSLATQVSIPSTFFDSTLDTPAVVDTLRYQIPMSCVDGSGFKNTHWYSFTSTQSSMVDIIVTYQEVPVVSGVYISDCSSKRYSCATFVDRHSTNQQQSVCGDYSDPIYYMIAGQRDRRGSYSVDISYSNIACSLAEAISDCENANVISSLPHNTYGNTGDATPFFDAQCIGEFYSIDGGEMLMAGHTWFTLLGDSFKIEMSSCSSADNIKFVVFEDSCTSEDCIAFSSTSCEVSWCGVPGKQYYIKMASFGPQVGDYEITVRNGDVCVAPPLLVQVVAIEKERTSITFAWNEPFAYGYPVLSYTYTLFDAESTVVTSGTTTEQQVTLSGLTAASQYYFTISATSEWGEGETTGYYEWTIEGQCAPYPLDIVSHDYVLASNDFQWSGNLLTPTSSGVIHSIEVHITDFGFPAYVYLALYESEVSLPSLFDLVHLERQTVFEDLSETNMVFHGLEWNICENRRYYIAYYFPHGASVYQSVDIQSTSTCIGTLQGLQTEAPTLDELFYNSQHCFWYNTVLDSEVFQMRIDADVYPHTNNLPPTEPILIEKFSSATSITLSWRESCSSSPITSYNLEINPSFSRVSLDATQREYKFSGLSPGGTFTIRLTAENQFGESQANTFIISTLQNRHSVQWLSQSGSKDSVGTTIPVSVGIDANRNSYSCGYFTDLAIFGDFVIKAEKFVTDSFLVKYDPDGNPIWVVHIGRGAFGSSYCADVAVSASGEVFMAGSFEDNIILADGAEPILTTNPGSANCFVAKYSTDGELLWSKHMGDDFFGFHHRARGVAIDSSDRVIVTGFFDGFVDLEFYEDGYLLPGNPSDLTWYNGFIAIWMSDGTLVDATSIYGMDYSDQIFPVGISTDSKDNIYVTGTHSNSFSSGSANAQGFYLPTYLNDEIFAVKYDTALKVQWFSGFGCAGQDFFDNKGITIEADVNSGVVVLGGKHDSTPFYYYPSTDDANRQGDLEFLSDIFYGPVLLGLDIDDGSVLWFNPLSTSDSFSSVESVSITDSGLIVAAGQYYGIFVFPESYDGIRYPNTEYDTGFMVGVDLSGELLWARWAGSQYNYQAFFGTASLGEAVVAVGYFGGSASFDCEKTVTTPAQEGFIAYLVPSEDQVDVFEEEENIECGAGFLSAESGSITFPSESNKSYPNGFACQWLIQVADVPHIMAIVTAFDFADPSDSLTFYDGSTTSSPVLHHYNGNTAIVSENSFDFYDNYYNRNEIMIQSTGPSLLVVFRSGDCFRGLGFSLTYESSHEASFCDNEFEQTLTLPSGLVSQRQKGGYRDNSDCFFYINPPSSSFVLAEFLQFELASEDYVEFIDETGTTSSILATFYGSDEPYPIQSFGNALVVHFVADSFLYDRGFVLRYEGIDVPVYCQPLLPLSDSNGEIRSQSVPGGYLPNASCEWDITVDEKLYDSVYVYFDKFHVPSPSQVFVNVTENDNRRDFAPGSLKQVTRANEVFVSYSPHIGIEFEAEGARGQGFEGEYCAHPIGGVCENEMFNSTKASFDNHFCGLYYAANSFCEWTFMPQTNDTIRHLMLTFPLVDFQNENVNNPKDFIDVQRGNFGNGPFFQVSRLAESGDAYQDPPTFITTSKAFHVVFQSDDEGFGQGFNATACASIVDSPNECNGVNQLASPEGTFNNYFCDKIHGADASCTWEVEEKQTPITGVIIVLSQLQFAFEQWNGEQWSDNLIIYENDEPFYYFNRGGAFDDKTIPSEQQSGRAIANPEIFSFDHPNVKVEFTSDSVGFTEGFNGAFCIFFAGDPRLCFAGKVLFALTGEIDNHACGPYYQANADCSYIIRPGFASNTMDIVLYILNADFNNPQGQTNDIISIYNTATVNQQNLKTQFSNSADYYAQQGISFPQTIIGDRDQMIITFKSDDVGFGAGFEAEYCSVAKPASTCGGGTIFTNHASVFRDHTCGPTYYAPMDCEWNFSPSTQNFTFIALVFNNLELGTGAAVEVSNPTGSFFTSDNYLNNVEDGTRIRSGSAVFLQSSTASLRFVVDAGSVLKKGWEVEYRTVTDTGICSGDSVFTDPQGYVQDHALGKFYQDNQECNFLIQIPGASAITVRFELFDLEEGYDFLEIYDGSSWSSELIGFLSGSETPAPFTTSSNSLYLTFRTDFTVVRGGFRLFYSDADLLECPLFCSGEGECVDGECQCNEDRFGSGCEIFPPPKATEARFSDSLDSILVSFERETNRAGMFGSLSNDCSILLADSTIEHLGFQPRCLWRDNKTFVIRMGNEGTIQPGDGISLNGGLIQDVNPTEEHPIGEAAVVTLQTARNPVAPVGVVIGPTVLQSGRGLKLDASATYITGGRKPFFVWSVDKVCMEDDCSLLQQKLQGYVSLQHDEILDIQSTYFIDYPDTARFHFKCVAVNFLGMSSSPVEHVVNAAPTAVPMVVIAGPEHYKIQRNEDLFVRSYIEILGREFDAIVEADACPSIQWQWTLTCLSGSCTNQVVPLPSFVTTIADIFIPADTLLFNTSYSLELEISYVEQVQFNTLRSVERVFIDVLPFQVDIEVEGGIQIVSNTDDLLLSANVISEQSELSNSISYRWACRKASGYLCQKTNDEFLALEDSSSIIIPADTLPPGDYIFSVIGTFEEGNLISKDRESVTVRILRRDQPVVKILRQGSGKHDSRKPLVLHSGGDDNISLQWSVSAGDLELSAGNIWSQNTIGSELVVAPNALQDGATYRFKLEGTRTNTSNHAEIEIVVNEAPTAGRIRVTPEFGYSLDTKFSFSVSGASDEMSDMPLKFVFSVIPLSCPGSELPNGNCPLIPISNTVEYPRFNALLPAGEYYPAVDIFDRIGSFRRVIAPFTITSFDTCPVTPDRMTEYVEQVAVIARAYDCLSDSDTVRQLVNIASLSLSCADFEIPDSALEVYFDELETLLTTVDEKTQTTEVFVDNQVKSFLLSSGLPISSRSQDISVLLRNSLSIANSAMQQGFLRTDSAESLLGGLSNLLTGEIAAEDVTNIFGAIRGIEGGQLRDRTCDTTMTEVSSTHIQLRTQRQSASDLAGSDLSTSRGTGHFLLPQNTGLSGCVNYGVSDFDVQAFQDNLSTIVSLPTSLTLTDENNEVIQLETNDPIEIRIPVSSDTTDNSYGCVSWDEEAGVWVENCVWVGVENGEFVMETNHLTNFAVLLAGTGGGGGGGVTITVSTFGSFASDFTGATELFGESNLDEYGNLLSSFSALSEIPTEAFATSNEVYDILQYSYSPGQLDQWTVDRILTLAFTAAAIICVIAAIIFLSIPAVRDRVSGKADRTRRVMARAEKRRQSELESLNNEFN